MDTSVFEKLGQIEEMPVEDRILIIERALSWVAAGIAALETQREGVLRLDPEYAQYLDAYHAVYADEALSIRGYYMYQARLEILNQQAVKEFENNGSVSTLLVNQIRHLEIRLAV